jgi:ribonuclease HI
MEVSRMTEKINVYTDGSCKLETRQGGWAYILDYKGYRKIGANHQSATTNNRMELTAAIAALSTIKDASIPVEVLTDSQYLTKGYESLEKWRSHGWRRVDNKPIANQDLWELLEIQCQRFNTLQFTWIRGHNGNKWNEYADKIANYASNFKAK